MKKRVLSFISAGTVATVLMLSLTLSTHKSHASTINRANIKALEAGGGGGKCTGPKTDGACGCSNAYPCSDQSNCSS